MVKRLFLSLLILSLTASLWAAPPPTNEEVKQTLDVILDSVASAVVASCSENPIALPGCTVSLDSRLLPMRISFLLADPVNFISALSIKSPHSTNFFEALFQTVTRAIEDPAISAVYLTLLSRDYEEGDFLINGAVNFVIPEGVTYSSLKDSLLLRNDTTTNLFFSLDMNIIGNKLPKPMTIVGNFKVYTNEIGEIIVNSVSTYKINEYTYAGGVFRF